MLVPLEGLCLIVEGILLIVDSKAVFRSIGNDLKSETVELAPRCIDTLCGVIAVVLSCLVELILLLNDKEIGIAVTIKIILPYDEVVYRL